MRANRSVSAIEIRFRSALWAAGGRGFRTGRRLPGRPDVVFPGVRLAIFLHGCYWHRCPSCAPRDVVANAAFWRDKFEANLGRDAAAEIALEADGWSVEIVWEHEVRGDVACAATRIVSVVSDRRTA